MMITVKMMMVGVGGVDGDCDVNGGGNEDGDCDGGLDIDNGGPSASGNGSIGGLAVTFGEKVVQPQNFQLLRDVIEKADYIIILSVF